MNLNDLKIGISGLRGAAVHDGRPAFVHALAFGRVLLERDEIAPGGRTA